MHLVDPFFVCFVLNHLNYFYHDQLAEINLARRHYQTQTDGRQLSDNSLHTHTCASCQKKVQYKSVQHADIDKWQVDSEEFVKQLSPSH